jgi:hypothetical protein
MWQCKQKEHVSENDSDSCAYIPYINCTKL